MKSDTIYYNYLKSLELIWFYTISQNQLYFQYILGNRSLKFKELNILIFPGFLPTVSKKNKTLSITQ